MKILLASLEKNDPVLNMLYACGEPNCPGMFVKEFSGEAPEEDIYSWIVSEGYDCIFFTSFTRNIEKTKYLCENLKKALPGIRLIICGAPMGYDSGEFLRENRAVDAVIFGEGEYTFSLVCRALTKGEPVFPEIRGLAYRGDGHIYVNAPMPPVTMESLPFIYEKLPPSDNDVLHYESVRGCPYNCIYCTEGPYTNMRVQPVEKVKEDLAYYIYKRPREVRFADSIFNWDQARALEIMEYIVKRDNGVTGFMFRIAGENIDDEFMNLVRNAREGLFRFRVDVQSQNNVTRKVIKGRNSVNKELVNVRRLSELGLADVYVRIMVGLPFEDMDSFAASFDSGYMTIAREIDMTFLRLERGTELRVDSSLYNYEYRSKYPYEIISNDFLSAREVVKLKRLAAVIDIFYNRCGYQATLNGIMEICGQSPFNLYMEFADFCQNGNYDDEYTEPYQIMKDYINWKCDKEDIPRERIMYYLNLDLKEKEKEKKWPENTRN